jgi:hypothetical protein
MLLGRERQNRARKRHPRCLFDHLVGAGEQCRRHREALRLELADMSEGVDLKKLRQIARAHIEKAASGDMQAIKELADRLDGKPAQILDLNDPDSNPIRKIVHEFVHVTQTPEELAAENEPVPIEGRGVRDANGSGGLNENTARTKR